MVCIPTASNSSTFQLTILSTPSNIFIWDTYCRQTLLTHSLLTTCCRSSNLVVGDGNTNPLTTPDLLSYSQQEMKTCTTNTIEFEEIMVTHKINSTVCPNIKTTSHLLAFKLKRRLEKNKQRTWSCTFGGNHGFPGGHLRYCSRKKSIVTKSIFHIDHIAKIKRVFKTGQL